MADRHSPQTLFARALIIIVVPMLLLQALSAWWFYSQRGDNVTNRLAQFLVRDLHMLITLRGDLSGTYHERAELYDFIRDRRIDGFVTVSGDRHAFWAGYAAKDLPPRAFEPVGVVFIGASISSPGMAESL